MKLETKQRKMLEMLRSQGLLSEDEEAQLKESLNLEAKKNATEKALANEVSREAESLLALIERQEHFGAKVCKQCGGPFATNFAQVSYCSNRCRRAHLESIGIPWDYRKSEEERWTAGFGKPDLKKVPLVVPPEALKAASRHPAVQKFIVEAMLELVAPEPPVEAPATSTLEKLLAASRD